MNSISIAKMIMYSIRAPPPPCRAARQRKAEEPSDETRSCLFLILMGYLSFVNIYVQAPAKRAPFVPFFLEKRNRKNRLKQGLRARAQGSALEKSRRFFKTPGFFSPAAFLKRRAKGLSLEYGGRRARPARKKPEPSSGTSNPWASWARRRVLRRRDRAFWRSRPREPLRLWLRRGRSSHRAPRRRG